MANATQDRLTRLYPITNNSHATHLKAQVYYALGGFNYFTYQNEPRGYYVSITPVQRENKNGYTMESFTAFTGMKHLAVPVQRKSAKKMDEAIKYFESHIVEFMQNHFGQFEIDTENYEVK